MKASAVHGSAARAAPPGSEHRWTVLAVIAVAQLMVALDATVVNIALPTAEAGLGFTDAQRVWVITAYTCAVAGLLLLGGRVADRFGRRRAFLASLAGFALASALAGAAPGIGVLIAGRALQGAFAAVLIPTALALVAVTFTQPHERARAFGVYGAVASSGAAVGLLLGGVLTEYADWRWCLYINVPIAVAASAVGARVLPRQPGAPGRGVDVVSGALVTVGLAAVVYGCVQAAEHGWFAPQVIVPGIIGAGLVAGFVRRQRRSAEPMLPLRVLASRGRAGAYMSVGAAVVGSFGMFLMLTYYFQVVLSLTPIRAGLAFLPMSVAVLASSAGLGSRPLTRIAPRLLVVPGLIVAASGLFLLSGLTPGSGFLTRVLPAEVMVGAGMGCVFTPAISVATSGIPPQYAGVAAATATTFMQVGGSVGTAAVNSVAVAAATAAGPGPAGVVHGFATAALAAGAVLLVAAAAAYRLVPAHAQTDQGVAP